jgi:hypothetical protein
MTSKKTAIQSELLMLNARQLAQHSIRHILSQPCLNWNLRQQCLAESPGFQKIE